MKPGELRQALIKHAWEKLEAKLDYPDPEAKKQDLGSKIDELLIKELYAEFVVADTNWGDAKERSLHVIAPDPTTGEAKLWKKKVPSGSMAPVPDDWLADKWQATQ